MDIGAEGTAGPTIAIAEACEGIEAAALSIRSGDISIVCTDDCLNAANSDLANYDFAINISGGNVTVWSGGNADNQPLDADGTIAITGGDLMPTLDGQPMPTYRAVTVQAGQVLRFQAPKTGCRCFIAFTGGLDIPEVMGSRSTYMKAKIGGYQGRKLQKDDVIGFRAPGVPKNLNIRCMSPEFIPRPVYTLRVVMGPQDDAFTQQGLDTFLSETYSVTNEFDRMGCRLDGPVIQHVTDGNIISDGIAFGAIQVPSEGKPIIMLGDRQTTGGYTKIANVISADFRLLGQLKAGDKVKFEKVSIGQAQDALLNQRAALRTLRHALDG